MLCFKTIDGKGRPLHVEVVKKLATETTAIDNEIPAGASGYVMITALPSATRGIEVEPSMESNGEALTDEELADLLSSGSPEKIRAALPRMNPEMKRLAQLALREP